MNIITIIIDTLRYDHIAANGNPDIHTPNLDRLVEKSWNFHRAFSASFPTIPHRNDEAARRFINGNHSIVMCRPFPGH